MHGKGEAGYLLKGRMGKLTLQTFIHPSSLLSYSVFPSLLLPPSFSPSAPIHTHLSCLYRSHCHLVGLGNGTDVPKVHIPSLRLLAQGTGSLPVPETSQRFLKECGSSAEESSDLPKTLETQKLPPKSRLHTKEAGICLCDLKSGNFTPRDGQPCKNYQTHSGH